MKAYKVELLIIDHDEIGETEIKDVLENARYPNRCFNPQVKSIQVRDIGAWSDEHPLNRGESADTEYQRLFPSAMPALERLTPRGSEFVGDPERCVAHVGEMRRQDMRLIRKFKDERDEALIEAERLQRIIDDLKDHCYGRDNEAL